MVSGTAVGTAESKGCLLVSTPLETAVGVDVDSSDFVLVHVGHELAVGQVSGVAAPTIAAKPAGRSRILTYAWIPATSGTPAPQSLRDGTAAGRSYAGPADCGSR